MVGNVLITFGGIKRDANGDSIDSPQMGKTIVEILEVTHTSPAEKVFELSIYDGKPEDTRGWVVYRAERLPSLYPKLINN